jgi:hypothetical protein
MSIYKSLIEKIRRLSLIRKSTMADSSYTVNNINLNKKHIKISKKRIYVDRKADNLNSEMGSAFSEYKNIQLSRYK